MTFEYFRDTSHPLPRFVFSMLTCSSNNADINFMFHRFNNFNSNKMCHKLTTILSLTLKKIISVHPFDWLLLSSLYIVFFSYFVLFSPMLRLCVFQFIHISVNLYIPRETHKTHTHIIIRWASEQDRCTINK